MFFVYLNELYLLLHFIFQLQHLMCFICYLLQVNSLVSGVEQWIVPGESAVNLASTNIQISVSSTPVSDTPGFTLSPPSTEVQAAYETIQPKITLGPEGLTGCLSMKDKDSGYMPLSMVNWAVNPYSTAKPVKSTIIRFSASTPTTTTSVSVAPTAMPTSTASPGNIAKNPVSGVPAFTVAIQYFSLQDFNLSAGSSFLKGRGSASNFTIPACTLYNGAQFVPCVGCNISSYTNYNVTYSCYDITLLCPAQSLRRHLLSGEGSGEADLLRGQDKGEVFEEGDKYAASDDDDDMSYGIRDKAEDDKSDGSSEMDRHLESSRFHQLDGFTDDDSSATSSSSSATFAVVLQAIGAELGTVLSVNPFALRLNESTAVLAFVGCLGGFILVFLVVFSRIDHTEKLHSIYLKKEKESAVRKMLEEDIKMGGAGEDLSALYIQHAERYSKGSHRGCSVLKSNKVQAVGIVKGSTGSYRDSASASASASPIPRKGSCNPLVYVGERKYGCNSHSSDAGTNVWTCDDSYPADDGHHEMTAVVTEFLHKLFPGRSIFKTNMNGLSILMVNHVYMKMFAGASLRTSRVIRFLEMISLVLVCIFVDTVLFGVFYPRDVPCMHSTNKVRTYLPDLHISLLCRSSRIVAAPQAWYLPLHASIALTPIESDVTSTLLYSTLLYSTLLYSTLLYSTLLYSTLL
jgi:hypothetical protein